MMQKTGCSKLRYNCPEMYSGDSSFTYLPTFKLDCDEEIYVKGMRFRFSLFFKDFSWEESRIGEKVNFGRQLGKQESSLRLVGNLPSEPDPTTKKKTVYAWKGRTLNLNLSSVQFTWLKCHGFVSSNVASSPLKRMFKLCLLCDQKKIAKWL